MPIRREMRNAYPPNWRAISLARREAAGWKCELCGIAQGAPTASGGPVVLTVMHLDHQPFNVAPSNLRAACQRCHLRYDAAMHKRFASRTRARKRGMGSGMLEL